MGHKLEARWMTEAASETFESRIRAEAIDHTTGLSGQALPATLASPRITRLAEQATAGPRPFWAFTIGVLAVPLGCVLSTLVSSDYRARI